jgi:transcriptional regulator with GAF, ATPase, and Fis domain
MEPNSDESQQLKRRIQELEEFQRFSESLTSRQTVCETLSFIAEWCAQLAHADNATVLLFKPASTESVWTLARSVETKDGGIDHGINAMAAGWVRSNGKALLTGDALREFEIDSPSERQKLFGPLLAIPLSSKEAMIGVLNLTRRAGKPSFTGEDLQLIAGTAPLAATFIERARRFEDITLDRARLKASAVHLHDQRWVQSVNPGMQEITDRIARVGPSPATVLITGETGTGKELVAWAIHLQSPRAEKPFVALNCGAIPATLADAELFGHERGAFTGAESIKPGKFELANGGTLFLDEISAMPMDLQPRLLRVLEERRFNRIGSSHDIKVDIRVIVATNKDLETEVKRGAFRDDLFHRLNVFPIKLPPLRERREDIPILAEAFLREFSGHGSTFAPDALQTLQEMSWPGNVRELRNLVERVSILHRKPEILRDELLRAAAGNPQEVPCDFETAIKAMVSHRPAGWNLLSETEKRFIVLALGEASGNITKAAALLGMGRVSLQRRMKKYRISSLP